jgi:hypothetical protein
MKTATHTVESTDRRDRPEPNFLEECATKLLCLSLLLSGGKKGARVSQRARERAVKSQSGQNLLRLVSRASLS